MLKLTHSKHVFSFKGLVETIKSYRVGGDDGMKIIPSKKWNGIFEGTPNVGYSRLHKHLSNMFYYRDLTLEKKLEKQPDKSEIIEKFRSNHYRNLYKDKFSSTPGALYYNRDYLCSNEFLDKMNGAMPIDDKKVEKYMKDKENPKKMQKYI